MKVRIKRTDFRKLKRFQKQSPKKFKEAMSVGGLAMLTWINNGSARSSKKPPIRWGVLRGSGSAFLGKTLIGIAKEGQNGTPATSYSGKEFTLTWVFNTDYAAKMHEHKGGWGPFTTQDGDAGNKYIEAHLKADKDALMKLIATEFKKKVKT